MTYEPANWLARYQAETAIAGSVAHLDQLLLAGIVTVTVEYDGEGDSGQIQSTFVENAEENRVEILDQDIWAELRCQIHEFTWGRSRPITTALRSMMAATAY